MDHGWFRGSRVGGIAKSGPVGGSEMYSVRFGLVDFVESWNFGPSDYSGSLRVIFGAYSLNMFVLTLDVAIAGAH